MAEFQRCRSSSRESGWSRRDSSSNRSDSSRRSGGETNVTPFKLCWAFGRNREVRVVNLTSKNNAVIFFVAAHAGVVYNYETDKMTLIQGHKNAITSVSVDVTGKWIVTADAGEDHVFIVWDTESWLPIRTVFNPHPKHGVRLISMSPDAKYIVTVSAAAEQVVALWLWTLGREEPDALLELPPECDRIRRIGFSQDKPEHFILTSNSQLIFVTWEDEALTTHSPRWKRDVGRLLESVYLKGTHQALTASSRGFVLIWSDVTYPRSHILRARFSNKKFVSKTIRLEEHAINVIKAVDNIVVTANNRGEIRFYDKYLRILYWCNDFGLGPVISINFLLYTKRCNFVFPVLSTDEKEEYEDRSEQNRKLCKKFPSDASLLRKPFPLREVIVGTKRGQLALINLVENTYKNILHRNEAKVTAMDAHPAKPYICVGNARGNIYSCNFITKEIINYCDLYPDNEVVVTSLKYSPAGLFIICGTENGTLWTLDPVSLAPWTESPRKHGSSAITEIAFSQDSKYIGISDESRCVSLFVCDNIAGTCLQFAGKVTAHFKPIRNIMFKTSSRGPPTRTRFFSVGEDRMLVEYELPASKQGEFKILCKVRIEQSAVPLGMTVLSKAGSEDFILVANSEYKFKLLNDESRTCMKTTLGPRFGSPVSLMKVLSPVVSECGFTYMVFATEKEIGIQVLPLDGNPHKSLGMVGHPTRVAEICTSADNRYLFTRGEGGYSVLMRTINSRAVDVSVRVGGAGLNPYLSLLDGGADGWLVREMQDFFYYVQLRYQGDNAQHRISNKVPLSEVPDLMRAVGYYPTEYEVDNLIREASYAKYAETGKLENGINFDDFVVLYINHLPAFGTPTAALRESFQTLSDGGSEVTRRKLFSTLQANGEPFSREQLHKYFRILFLRDECTGFGRMPSKEDIISQRDEINIIPERVTFEEFSKDILGIHSSVLDSHDEV